MSAEPSGGLPAMSKARANRLDALRNAPGWADLEKEFAAAENRFAKRQLARIMAGEPVDQREADYMRGKLDAARTILRQPARATRYLDKLKAEQEAEQREE